MKKNIEIVVLLDKSGSMTSIWDSTIEGFNKFIIDQKEKTSDAKVSLIQFDHRYQVSYEFEGIQDVELLNKKLYIPEGTTALLDAMGRTIQNIHKQFSKQIDVPNVIFVVITDGYENASTEYSQSTIKKLVKEMENNNNWQFIYLGANQDAITEGERIGFSNDRSMTFANNDTGVSSAFMSLSENVYQCLKMDKEFKFSDEDRNLQESAFKGN